MVYLHVNVLITAKNVEVSETNDLMLVEKSLSVAFKNELIVNRGRIFIVHDEAISFSTKVDNAMETNLSPLR